MKQNKLSLIINCCLSSSFTFIRSGLSPASNMIANRNRQTRSRIPWSIFFLDSANFFPRCALPVVGFLLPSRIAMLEHCDSCSTLDLQELDINVKVAENFEENRTTESKTEKSDAVGMFINFSSDMSDSGFKAKRKYKRAYKVNGVNILNRWEKALTWMIVLVFTTLLLT